MQKKLSFETKSILIFIFRHGTQIGFSFSRWNSIQNLNSTCTTQFSQLKKVVHFLCDFLLPKNASSCWLALKISLYSNVGSTSMDFDFDLF
jgi:hypothetical protein